MKFLYKIYRENQNLKNFQRQVFNLSKNYDDIKRLSIFFPPETALAQNCPDFLQVRTLRRYKKEEILPR
jgi:hypothetical protein